MHTHLEAAVADRLEDAGYLDHALSREVRDELTKAFPAMAGWYDLPIIAGSTDAALHLVSELLPDWSITLEGYAREPKGHWRCTLRESAGRDDDGVVGIGRAQSVALAVLAALARVATVRRDGFA